MAYRQATNVFLGALCTILVTQQIREIQTSPQRMREMRVYEFCQEIYRVWVQRRSYLEIDGKETSAMRQVDELWDSRKDADAHVADPSSAPAPAGRGICPFSYCGGP